MAVPEQLGDFQIVEEIGRGGFGIVYRARQVSLDRPVAVKVLYKHLIHTEEQISRFEREARAAARLDHPAIVSVYAWGGEGDEFFIAQRLIGSGRTMADELVDLKEQGEPEKGYFRRIAESMATVAEGLQQAHDRGIVHRDVKPSNILLDENGDPVLGDFGLAKIEDGLELSRTGDFAGSPFYMSPEQADSKVGPVDARSDIYSLGVTLYEMLTLHHPFLGKSSHEIMRKILAEEPQRPTKLQPRVPADLETICLHAMEKRPDARYASAHDFALDLKAFLDGEPISAVPIGTVSRLMRQARRHSSAVGMVALAVVLVAGGSWAWREIKSLKVDAQAEGARATIETSRRQQREEVDAELQPQIDAALREGNTELALQLRAQQEKQHAAIDQFTRDIQDKVAELAAAADTKALQEMGTVLLTDGLVQGGLKLLGTPPGTSLESLMPAGKAGGEVLATSPRPPRTPAEPEATEPPPDS